MFSSGHVGAGNRVSVRSRSSKTKSKRVTALVETKVKQAGNTGNSGSLPRDSSRSEHSVLSKTNERNIRGGRGINKKKEALAEEKEVEEWGEGESEAKQWWDQRLIGHFTSFHPTVKWIWSKRFDMSQKLKGDFNVFPLTRVKPFNKFPEWRKKKTPARTGRSLSRVNDYWASSYCSL